MKTVVTSIRPLIIVSQCHIMTRRSRGCHTVTLNVTRLCAGARCDGYWGAECDWCGTPVSRGQYSRDTGRHQPGETPGGGPHIQHTSTPSLSTSTLSGRSSETPGGGPPLQHTSTLPPHPYCPPLPCQEDHQKHPRVATHQTLPPHGHCPPLPCQEDTPGGGPPLQHTSLLPPHLHCPPLVRKIIRNTLIDMNFREDRIWSFQRKKVHI